MRQHQRPSKPLAALGCAALLGIRGRPDLALAALGCTALLGACGRPSPAPDASPGAAPSVSTTPSASSSSASADRESAAGTASVAPPRDDRPFAIASESEALQRVQALPEAREPLLLSALGSTQKEARSNQIAGRPEPGCVEGADTCRWHVASGMSGPDSYLDRHFYLDARSGALHVYFLEAWPEGEGGGRAKPYAEWQRLRERSQKAWALVKALPEVKAVKRFGMQPHAPEPYECTASTATPCRFRFDVCDRVRSSPCEANMPDTLATFVVDDSTGVVRVEAQGVTEGDDAGPVTVARWRELVRSRQAALRAVEGRPCAGGKMRPAVFETAGRVGCKPGDATCAWVFDMYFEAKGGVAYRNRMSVDAASHEINVASRQEHDAAGPTWPLATFCERVARGEELTLAQWLRGPTP
jgi:hypothetical protein